MNKIMDEKKQEFFIDQIRVSKRILDYEFNDIGTSRLYILITGIILLREFLYEECPKEFVDLRNKLMHDGGNTSFAFITAKDAKYGDFNYVGIYYTNDDSVRENLEDVYRTLYEKFEKYL